jgi:hypothetical protein
MTITEVPDVADIPEETTPTDRAAEAAAFRAVETGEDVADILKEMKADEPEAPPEVAVEASTEKPADAPAAPVEPELTPAEIRAMRDEISQLKEAQEKTHTNLHGKFGELNKALRDLRAAPGRQLTVEQFPKMTEMFGKDYVQAYVDDENARLAAPAPVAEAEPKQPPPDTGKTREDLQDLVARGKVELRLTQAHPDWEKVTSGADFIAWRDSHPKEVAEQIRYSRDADYLIDVINGFKGHQQAEAEKLKPKAPPKPETTRLAAAITPTGAPPAGTSKTLRADMEAGFNSVKFNE